MNKEDLAIELSKTHYQYASTYLKVFDFLSSYGEDGVLYKLNTNEDNKCTASDLSNFLDISSGRMTNILNQLENKKLIIRKKDEIDKRKVYIFLTQEGKDKITKKYDRSIEIHKKILDTFNDQEVIEFVHSMKKLTKELNLIENLINKEN